MNLGPCMRLGKESAATVLSASMISIPLYLSASTEKRPSRCRLGLLHVPCGEVEPNRTRQEPESNSGAFLGSSQGRGRRVTPSPRRLTLG
jgi:hypothetical protein